MNGALATAIARVYFEMVFFGPPVKVAHFYPAFVLLTSIAFGQSDASSAGRPRDARSKIADAIIRVSHDDVGSGPVDVAFYVELAAQGNPVQVIPILETFYARSTDPEIRADVASTLVRIGDKNKTYWDLIWKEATVAVESNPPYPYSLANPQPNVKPEPSAEFLAWAKAHNLSEKEAYAAAGFTIPFKLTWLAKSGDARGIPLLRRALNSSNLLMQGIAAAGLAEAHDKKSVPLIISACTTSKGLRAAALADSLIYFDDPEADRVWKIYNPDVDISAARKFRGNSPYHHPAKSD